jgi:protein-S-isoprenylcysteine O-methyltransferase Ste14
MALFKTFIFTVLVPGTVTVLIPYWLLTSSRAAPLNPGVFRYFGILVMTVGVAIYLWCAWDFSLAGRGTPAPIDPPKDLVVRGLYRHVRNPMYVGILSILVGEAIFFASTPLFQYAAIAFTFFFLFVLVFEEPMLKHKFGQSYEEYRRKVPRWLPWKFRG